jgi:protein-L-isoaspartate(D-aspartate) O-methyltransferase
MHQFNLHRMPDHAQNARWSRARGALVRELEREGGISDAARAAIGSVPRHEFIPAVDRHDAYANHPVPIGLDQTISQPFMVGWLADAVGAAPGRRILEIGTGCGYQAAVMSSMGASVWSIEVRPPLAERARATLDRLSIPRIITRIGDGGAGWPEEAPFGGIVLTAAPEVVPPALFDQLGPGGVLVAPVGREDETQELRRWTRRGGGTFTTEVLGLCRFVPMVRPAG